MVGSPKKRARRLALEAERARLGLPADATVTVTPAAAAPPPAPTPEPHRERHEPRPHRQPPEPDDPIVALLEDRYRASEEQTEEGGEALPMAPQEAKFNKLRELALDSAIEIMSLKLDPDHKSFDKLLARKTTISAAVMTTTVRVDAGILRARVRDRVEELLEAVREAEGKPKN